PFFSFFWFSALFPVSPMSHSPKPPSLAPSRKSVFREEFSSEHTLPYLNLGRPAAEDPDSNDTAANMASPTPRELRRLASDHNFVLGATDPAPRRLGFLPFLARNLSLVVALIAGVISVAVAIAYTVVTSRQLLECPPWANGCRSLDPWTSENLGVIQGIITAVYLIGLSALAYICLSLCEAALWPLLHTQPLTISGLEGFLALAHGNIMLLPQAVTAIRSVSAGLIFAVALLSILLPLAAPPLVGYAYTPTLEAVAISSNISSSLSSVLDRPFTQTNPPSASFIPAFSAYTTYANDPSSEPLPAFRNWLFDRAVLATRGSFTAKAVHLDTNITCRGQQLKQLYNNGLPWNAFKTTTNLSSPRHPPSGEVWFSPSQPLLTVYLDDVKFPSSTSINTTIIFAALNGTITGGQTTNLTTTTHGNTITTVSAISCQVLLSASDGLLTTPGSDPSAPAHPPVLSSLSHLKNTTTSALLWLTASPLLVSLGGPDGSQPLFSNSSLTHLPMIPSQEGINNWTIPGLESFLHLSIGAAATSLFSSSLPQTETQSQSQTQTQTQTQTQELISILETRKLSAQRGYLLFILPLSYVLLITLTSAWDVAIHTRYQIPVFRPLTISELLKSSQTGFMREQAGTDAAKSYLPSELGGVGVRFGVVEGGEVGFGFGSGGGRGVGGFVQGNDNGSGSGSRVGVGRRAHTGHSSVSWAAEDLDGGGGRGEGGAYRMERGEWPRNEDV
ncbi:hypothetical protein QBC41DRAFT_386494, partial [Cercophora samala]